MDSLFSKEDSLLRGYLNLGPDQISAIKAGFKGLSQDGGLIKDISFRGNGYVTDGLLYLISKYAKLSGGLSAVIKVDLSGCSKITDHGIKYLYDSLADVKTLKQLLLDGCDKLTENSGILLSRLQRTNPELTLSMMCTRVKSSFSLEMSPLRYLIRGQTDNHLEDYNYGQVLIIPQRELKCSLLQYLVSGTNQPRPNSPSSYMANWSLDKWTLAVSELCHNSTLFEYFINTRLTQVLIPFDSKSDVKDIMQHISESVTRVLAKEPMTCQCPPKDQASSSHPFMEVHRLDKMNLLTDSTGQSFVRSISMGTEEASGSPELGTFVSKHQLTRSNPKFDIRIKPSQHTVKLLLGVVFDVIFAERFCMQATTSHGGVVEKIETKGGKEYTFGLDGQWLSEYIPDPKAKFYIEENGLKYKSDSNELLQEKPQSGMYPLVCILIDETSDVILPQILPPSPNFKDKMEAENRWVERGWVENLAIDKKGRITSLPYIRDGKEMIFISRNAFTEQNSSYSLCLNNVKGGVVFGAGSEQITSLRGSQREEAPVVCLSVTCPEQKGNGYKVQLQTATGKKDLAEVDWIHEGDTIEVKVETKPSEASKMATYAVIFMCRDKQIVSETLTINMETHPARCVPIIYLPHDLDMVTLNNYRPAHKPKMYNNKITVGVTQFLNVMDDGEMEYIEPKVNSGRSYGHFVAKQCLNRDLLEFEVEVLSLDSKKMLGVGLVAPDFPYTDSFIGWSNWTIGLHGDNGGLYFNTSHSDMKKPECRFEEGTVIKVKVVPKDNSTPLRFDEDGDLESQQDVMVQFFVADKLAFETEYKILTEGIYPAFSLKGTKVHVKNFYAETKAVWNFLNKEDKSSGEKTEVKISDWCTEFVALAVSDGSDATGKLDLVQQQLDIAQWPQLAKVDREKTKLEANLPELDLQDQERFSQLCAIQHNLQQLRDNPQRLTFKTVDVSQAQDQDKLQSVILSAMNHQQSKLGNFNKLQSLLVRCEKDILNKLETLKVICVSKIFTEVPSLDQEYLEGRHIHALLAEMHSQGKCLVFEVANDKLVINAGFAVTLETKLGLVLPTEMKDLGSLVPSISSKSHVWSRNTLANNILTGVPAEKLDDMRIILQEVFGVYVLKCLRTRPTDDLDIFVQAQHLANQTQASIVQYWELNMDRTDVVMMRHTYQLLMLKAAYILPLLVAIAIKYGRVVLLTSQGVVCQNGSVQTVIILHTSGDRDAIVVESRCYMPKIEENSTMSKQTPSYVTDYTWNVFCVYTDIIDDYLMRLNIAAVVEKETPTGLVNVSVGCKHNWAYIAGKPVQSVCTLCNNCCHKGINCDWNSILADDLRHCGCQTTVVGCQTCGICIKCAQDLWAMRTRLRPFGLMMTEVAETLNQKIAAKHESKETEKVDKQMLKDPVKHAQIPLDPHVYNEVEFLSLDSSDKALCLKEESAGTLMQVCPGRARYVDDITKLKMTSTDSQFTLWNDDIITLRLSDTLGVSLSSQSEEVSDLNKLTIEPQYFALQGREVKVIHETGIVLYDTDSGNIPVGQLIACKPMTAKNKTFSIRVLKTGASGTIAIGLVPQNYPPNRQPGWNQQSIAYHADDGGIFLESGYHTRITKPATVGDIMQLQIDFDRNKGWFRKNDEKMIELNLNPSRLGFYPCIGFHSLGEAVQIIEKEIWLPENEQQRGMTPPAYSTYKYGNLWISPGESVPITSTGSRFTGWLVLHNPKKEQVGFKVTCVIADTDDVYYGILDHKKDWIQSFSYTKGRLPTQMIVEWVSLESGRTYAVDDMKLVFADHGYGQARASYQHILPVVVIKSSDSLENVPTTADLDPVKSGRPMLQLEILKNHRVLETYWVKHDNYLVSVETNSSNFLLRYPKCPTFIYARTFQKGMKLCAYIESAKVFYECVVVEVYEGGKNIALEYSPMDKDVNMTVCVRANSPALKFQHFDEKEDTLIPYQTRNTPAALYRTFVHAPPYLLSEGGKLTQTLMDKEAKANTLRSVSSCVQVFTRLTVQEHNIWQGAMHLKNWKKIDSRSQLFAVLPENLSLDTLLYPKVSTMFRNISIHRLCFSQVELTLQAGMQQEVSWRLPVHFVDIPGMKPSKPLALDETFGDGTNVWTYATLIAHKIHLPSYKMFLAGDTSSVLQGKIEHLLHQLLQVFTSLCGIYSAPWGGIEYTPECEYNNIKNSIRENDTHVVKGVSQPQTDPHILIKHSSDTICKAHYMNFGSEDRIPEGATFTYDYFKPYTSLVTMFFWSHPCLEKLPDDFFEEFSNLQYFAIGHQTSKLDKFTSIPKGISTARHLKVIEITNTAMTSLPEDIFLNPSAVSISCTDMAVSSVPSLVADPSPLEDLVLSGMKLETVPSQLGNMSRLTNLELCYNPLKDLPQELEKLGKLRQLKLSGSPWLTLQGKKTQITHDQYKTWFNGYPFFKNYLGEQLIEEMFQTFDLNSNGSLDEEEIAHLNLEMFFKIPRLGLQDLNDEATGGIPEVVFKLRSLTSLYLDYNAITLVPAAINNLQNLTTLSINHCPLLASLPGSLGHLPNIAEINVNSCPMLRTPPTEVVSRGFESVKAYLKQLAGGFTECHRTKLMVVGLGGAGKTSLLRALMSKDKQTSSTESEIPTDGIDIVPWTVESEDGHEITYSTWDFAGQAVYYNTHQFFLSKRAVYLLLWSMRQGYEHAGLDFWLSSISCHAPKTPILVIGTQCDLIPQAEIPEKELMERYPQIVSFHQVSSIKGTGIPDLQKKLVDVTLQQAYMGEKIPKVWLNMEKRLLDERKTKCNYIKWEDAKKYALEQGIYDVKDVRMCIQLLHDLGTVQYFDNDFLRDYVVINPQWIVDVMACVVSAQDSPIQKEKGKFYHRDIPTVWQAYDESLHQWLLRLTEDFDLTFPLPKEPVNIVPCLLSGEPPKELMHVWTSIDSQQNIRETRMVYRFTYLPSGLFNRAQVRLFQFSDGKIIWKKGSMLSKNGHLALLKQADNMELVVVVKGPQPQNILFLIHEVFESIIEESFNGVQYDLYLPCPDCELKGCREPDLLNSKLIQRAKDCKAPFLQCYKFFHWISMAQLQEKIPSSDIEEFDIQLQQSVVALQDLIDKLVVDVAIIYNKADVPADGDTNALSPFLVRDDIQSWGYSCWIADNMDEVDQKELMQSVRACRVLIAFISDNFECDINCCNIFLNALERMNKKIIPVQVGTTSKWEERDLGMQIGSQTRKLMALNRQRYIVENGRRDELKDWLGGILAGRQLDSMNPDVFISYARVNSKKAMIASNRQITSAVGYGDPRDIKDILEKEGISCWIDSESIGFQEEGIYSDMAAGIRNSKAMVACISDEYAESSNCMMELRFGIFNIQLPLVVAIVGTGNVWKEKEAAMLLRRAKVSEVYLQKDNPEGLHVLLAHVKEALKTAQLMQKEKKKTEAPKSSEKETKQEKEEPKKQKVDAISYQEEFELIQRKFMRYIIGRNKDELPVPRLLLVDFVKAVDPARGEEDRRESMASNNASAGSSSRKRMLRPKTASKSRDRLQIDPEVFEDNAGEDWASESFCIRVLCEHEGGWHLCSEKYPLAFRSRDRLETFLRNVAAYLHRLYTLLKSSPINLHCFSSNKGKAFMDWIKDQNATIPESQRNDNFVAALAYLRSSQYTAGDDSDPIIDCLARCRLPSGKVVWLCETHQKEEHVVKLNVESTTSYITYKVLFNEDKLFMENIEHSDKYKHLKSIPSNKTVDMPSPVPYSTFETEKLQRERQQEALKEREVREQEIRERAALKAKMADKAQPKEQESPITSPENGDAKKKVSTQPNVDQHEIEEPNNSSDKTANDNVLNNISTTADKQDQDKPHISTDKSEITNKTISNTTDNSPKHVASQKTENEPLDSVLEENIKSIFKATTKPKRRPSQHLDPTSPLDKLSLAIGQSHQTVSRMKEIARFVQTHNDSRSLKRGSTVRNLHTKDTSLIQTNNRKGESDGNFETLAPTLLIHTINNPSSESTSSASSGGTLPNIPKTSKKEAHPVEKVRPKKIQVKPKPQESRSGVTDTSQFALPNRQGSQACVLQ